MFLANHSEIKLIGRVSPAFTTRRFFLNRQISWADEGFEWSGDERHVKRLGQILNIEGFEPAASPGTKATGHSRDCLHLLNHEETTLFPERRALRPTLPWTVET